MKLLLETDKWMIQGAEDYSNLFSPEEYNWVEYTPLQLRFEWNKKFGQLELELALLGLHLHISYVHDEKQHRKEVKRLLKIANSPKTKWTEL